MPEKHKELISRVKGDLRKKLSKYRYEHSDSVAKTALEFAMHIKSFPEKDLKKELIEKTHAYKKELSELYILKIELAAYLHDYCKELKNKEILELAKFFRIKIYEEDLEYPNLLHSRVGASVVEETYEIYDQIILGSIWDHTFGSRKMSLASKIVYLADTLEPMREEESDDKDYLSKLKELRSIIMDDCDIDKAVLETMNYKIINLTKKNKVIHPLSIDARNAALGI